MFSDRLLVADVRMDLPFAAERRFWFGPPFHSGWTAHARALGHAITAA